MKKYDLSTRGIQSLEKDITIMQQKMVTLKTNFVSRSLDFLEQQAKYYIEQTTGGSNWYVLTHTLENSFKKDVQLQKIINDCYYSAWVEYGTGTVGEGTHDDPKNYRYDVNNHGDNGWWFFDEDGNIHWTKGMTAHRYMYQSLIDYISGEYKRIFKELFEKEIGGIFK